MHLLTPKMKNSLRFVYKHTCFGWLLVRECQSFEHACRVAKELTQSTGVDHCVNNW